MGRNMSSSKKVYGTIDDALNVDTADECAKFLQKIPDRFEVFPEAMLGALRGEWPSVVVLVNLWQNLIVEVLTSAWNVSPNLVTKLNEHFCIRTSSNVLSDEPVRFLNHHISEVPFSAHITSYGNVGVGVEAIDAVRTLLPGWTQLRAGVFPGWRELPQGSDMTRYRHLVELAIGSIEPPLVRVRQLFSLNKGEVADLFGVTRQAVEQWERIGDVPAARREKLANLLSAGQLLERKLSPGRLPLVARKRADIYGGLTMLDMVRADRDGELRELTERAFDWSVTA